MPDILGKLYTVGECDMRLSLGKQIMTLGESK